MEKKIQEEKEIQEETKESLVNPEKIERTREIVITAEETDRILDQLFEFGYATTEFEVIPDRANAVVRSLGADDQLELEKFMSSVSGSAAYVLHTYSKMLLKYTLVEYGNDKMTPKAVEAFLGKLSGSLLHKIVTGQNYFERQVRKATEVDEIDKHFFGTPSTSEE